MNPVIRKMTSDDILTVVELDKMSFSLPWPERSFRFELTDNPASRCWVAEVGEIIVGMIVVWLLVAEAHVATLATHPNFRRQGIAKRLLSHALQYLNSEGAQSSFLEVRAGNIVAQEMYRKFGYKESGRRRHYYKDNDEDAILMHLDPLKVEHFMSAIGPSTLDKEEQNER